MLTLSIEDLLVELEDGAVKHVGPKTTDASVTLYHVEDTEARAFGDRQLKLAFADGEGNEVEIALDRDAASELADGIEGVQPDD